MHWATEPQPRISTRPLNAAVGRSVGIETLRADKAISYPKGTGRARDTALKLPQPGVGAPSVARRVRLAAAHGPVDGAQSIVWEKASTRREILSATIDDGSSLSRAESITRLDANDPGVIHRARGYSVLTDPSLTQQPNGGAPLRRGERRKQHTKRRLIDAAMEIYAECGVDGTTISAVTERADVGLGTFYLHFADKDAIAETVCDIIMARLIIEERETFEMVESLGQAADRVAIFVRVMCARVAEAPELLAALLRWEGPRTRNATTPAIDSNPLRVMFIGHLTKSMSQATYRESDPELMARAIIGMSAQCVPAWIESGRTDWTALAGFLERAGVAAFAS